jgi:uncharacterized membrane protein YphA (DoxX/SURF4 family)
MRVEEIVRHLPALFGALILAILFIQSGLDKVFDWKGNLGWLTGHFSKTFLAPTVPLLLATITVMELTTGVLSAIGIVHFFVTSSASVIFWSAALGTASLSALFFGQRIAKDYPGAAVLIPYFLLTLFLMYLTNPYSRPAG